MFTWICPTCGREVPPAYDECPDCAAKSKSGERPAEAAAVPPPPPVATTAPPPPAPPTYTVPPPSTGLPTWLLTIIFALAFAGLGAGIYWLAHTLGDRSQAASPAPIANAPSAPPAKENALQNDIEVTGIRFVQNSKKQTEARFVVVNHSGADISDLAGTVSILGRTAKSEEEAAGTFSFRVPSLGPYDSKEQAAPVRTKLRVYELPDWQKVSAHVQLTSP